MGLVRRFWRDENGGTALEYAIVGGLVSAGLIAVFATMGTQIANKFPSISNALN